MNRYQPPKSIPATLYHVQWLDPQNGPAYLEFRFIYRSKEVLVSKGILPSLSVPTPNLDETLTGPKKRKTPNENNTTKRKASSTAKKVDPSPSSPTNLEATPPKPARLTKKPRVSTKSQVKKQVEVKNEIEVKDIVIHNAKDSLVTRAGKVSSDSPMSPTIEVLQHRQVVSRPGHHVVPDTVLPWVESQSATIDIPVDILRELRELRVSIQSKR